MHVDRDTIALAAFVIAALAPAGAALGFMLKLYSRFTRMEDTLKLVLLILRRHCGDEVVVPELNGRSAT